MSITFMPQCKTSIKRKQGRSKKTSFTLTTLASIGYVSSTINLALEFLICDHFDKVCEMFDVYDFL